MLRRLTRFLVFAIESALPMHAAPPESVRRSPWRPARAGRSLATILLALLVSASASAGGFGLGGGAAGGGGLGGVGFAPALGLDGVAAVQHYHGQAAAAATERDCQARHRSFRSRTTLRPSERQRQLAACLDLARGAERVDVAQQGE